MIELRTDWKQNLSENQHPRRGDHRIRNIKHGKGCNDHSMKRRRTRTRLQLVPETTGGRLVCGKELLFSWRCSHSRFTRETSSLPCFRYRILPSRLIGWLDASSGLFGLRSIQMASI